MGTLVVILLGNGVVAGVLLKQSKAEGSGWMAITTAWAFAVMSGIFTATACGSPDAHLNPAITLGFAVSSGNFTKIIPYMSAQLLGAFAGAILSWAHFSAALWPVSLSGPCIFSFAEDCDAQVEFAERLMIENALSAMRGTREPETAANECGWPKCSQRRLADYINPSILI